MKVPRVLRSAVLLRLVLLVGLLFAGSRLMAPTTFGFNAGDLVVRVSAAVPGGRILLDLGPFGELAWRTHATPLDVKASFVIGRSPRELPGIAALRDLRVAFLLRKLPWLALMGGFGGALVFEGARRRRIIGAGIGAATLVIGGALVIGATVVTFDARALDRPRYRGPIEDAPRVLAILSEIRGDVAGAHRNINKVAEGLQRLHAQILASGAPAGPSGPTVRLLVVSDLHNNPLGLLVAQELVKQFGVRGVLNAGDFTDRGTEPEAELFAAFGTLAPMQLAVGGNHEDRVTLDRIRRIPGMTVLERGGTDVATIEGVKVLGDSDPNAYGISSNPFDDTAEAEIPLRCEALRQRWEAERPIIVMVHDPRQGRCAADAARAANLDLVFVWGHTHRPALDVSGSVLEVSAGTSGANGVKTPKEAPYGFAMLELEPVSGRVVSACLFAFDDPGHLRDASCRVAPLEREAAS
jgi:predicted phosphodiesterase